MPVEGSIPRSVKRENKKAFCQRCGISNEMAFKRDGQNLNLHHRDRDRTNNSPLNLETLCSACHTKEHWIKGKQGYKKSLTCYACRNASAVKRGLCETCRTRARRHGNPFYVKKKVGRHWILVDTRTRKRVTRGTSQA